MFVPAWARFSLIFQYGDMFVFRRSDGELVPTARAGVTGPLTEALMLGETASVSIKMVGVDLRPLAAFEVVGDEVSRLKNAATPFDELLARPETERVTDALRSAAGDRERLTIVEDYLLGLFTRSRYRTHPLVRAAVESIHESSGRINVAALSRSLGWTDRHLRREFGRALGLSPKKYAQLQRVESVINRLYAKREGSLARIAQDFEYHDESHLINDVKRHTLLSPGELIATGALDWLKLYLM